MKDQKENVIKALTTKHIETIEATKLSSVYGGNIVVCEDMAS